MITRYDDFNCSWCLSICQAVNLVELSDCKQFYEGLKFLDKNKVKLVISGDLAYAMYDSLGLREDDIETLASIKGSKFWLKSFD